MYLLMNILENGPTMISILVLAFMAILFLQSGLDKVFNYKSNLEWLTGHFSKSILRSTVGLLMPIITLLEVAAGALCAIGLVFLLINGSNTWGYWGCVLSAISVLCLFFGQRLAQQYEGAFTLTTYFLIALVGIFFLSVG